MKLIRRYKRYIASFLILNVACMVMSPSVSLASVPTTPEVSNFEPLENSDLVNLSTGDFIYNKQLLSLPGRGPGYPISMSYHAGISPIQEASWVGLGWSLNTGAISRSLAGLPDDWNGVREDWTQHWVGGKQIRAGLSVTFPIYTDGPNTVATTLGMNYIHDTYRGSAFGYQVGMSFRNDAVNVGVTYNSNRITGNSLTLAGGVGISKAMLRAGVHGSVTLQGDKVRSSVGLGISYVGFPLAGASYSSAGFNVSAGGPVTSMARFNNLTVEHYGFSQSFGKEDALSINLDFGHTKYYIDESGETYVHGALYFPDEVQSVAHYDNHAYDVVDLIELNNPDNVVSEDDYPRYGLGNEMQMGGTVPGYDAYMVATPGISGSIRPVNYLENLARQNKKTSTDDHEYYRVKQYVGTDRTLRENQDRAEFAFGGFSNYYRYDQDKNNSKFSPPVSADPLRYYFSDAEIETANDADINTNVVPQGRYIKWFSNREMVNADHRAHGLMENVPETFLRAEQNDDLIGGFLAVNESGMAYHYTLPAYNLEEETHNYNVHSLAKDPDDPDKWIKSVSRVDERYAYAWHLTGITGPDYVDRGGGDDGSLPNNTIDDADWGHWVRFDYGLWTDQYKWRIPEVGFEEAYDGNFKTFRKGVKEIYYLNEIRTPTHTALFIKDPRKDGHGLSTTSRFFSWFTASPGGPYPAALLKLSEILIVKNEGLPNLDYSYSNSFGGNHPNYGKNVLLTENLSEAELSELREYTIDGIRFETDYSLMPNTPNSFANDYFPGGSPNTTLSGKLTLKSIQTIGRNGETAIPPETYTYINPTVPYCKDCVDFWGYYKSDYKDEIKEINVRHMPTETSAAKMDSWSLGSVTFSLGSTLTVDYEADTYSEVSIEGKTCLSFTNLTNEGLSGNRFKAYFSGLDPLNSNIFSVGQEISAVAVVSDAVHKKWSMIPCNDIYHFDMKGLNFYKNNYRILSLHNSYMVIQLIDDTGSVEHIDYPLPTFTENTGRPDGTPKWNCGALLCDIVSRNSWTRRYKHFIGGEMYFAPKSNQIGGGLRVSRIEVSSGLQSQREVYLYDYQSSGSVPYVPIQLNQFSALDYPDYYEDKNGWYKDGEECEPPIWPWLFPATRVIKLIEVADKLADLGWLPRKSAGLILPLAEEFMIFKRKNVLNKTLALQGMLPSGVTYGKVKVTSGIEYGKGFSARIYADGYEVYEFQTADESLVDIEYFAQETHSGGSASGASFRSNKRKGVHFKNLAAAIGTLKRHTKYNNDGKKVSSVQYVSLHDEVAGLDAYDQLISDKFSSQGVFSEMFVNGRLIPYDVVNEDTEPEYLYDLVGMMTKRTSYPVVPVKVIHTDYMYGTTSSSRNLAFDLYTGQPAEIYSVSAAGQKTFSYSIPAYRLKNLSSRDAYPGMGLKALNTQRKNMLSQEGASAVFKVSDAFDPDHSGDIAGYLDGLIGAGLQTWSDHTRTISPQGAPGTRQEGIFRKKAAYGISGNGLNMNDDGTLDATLSDVLTTVLLGEANEPDTDQGWRKRSEVTIYDVNSEILEIMDINHNHASTKYDLDQKKIIATASNARYDEFAYSGAEDWDGGNLFGGDVVRNSSVILSREANGYGAHTGDKSFGMSAGTKGVGFTVRNAARNSQYVVTFWSTNPDCEVAYAYNGSGSARIATDVKVRRAGSWYWIQAYVPTDDATNELEVYCKGPAGASLFQVDDFRVAPVDAASVAYVHNKRGELFEILDNNNFFTRYEYDGMGRLKRVFRETIDYGIVKVSESTIKYANQ